MKRTASQRALDRTVREVRAANRQRGIESLTPAEIEARMVRVIAERVGEAGAVTRDDFLRAGIPAAAIQPNYRRCLALAREADPRLGRLEIAA